MTRVEAEDVIERWVSAFPDYVVDRSRTGENDVGWVVMVRPREAPHVPESWRNIQNALWPESANDDPFQYSCSAWIVARNGKVFTTASAFPVEAFLEDVRVLTGMTLNPLRVARYVFRRVFDGRTAHRWRNAR